MAGGESGFLRGARDQHEPQRDERRAEARDPQRHEREHRQLGRRASARRASASGRSTACRRRAAASRAAALVKNRLDAFISRLRHQGERRQRGPAMVASLSRRQRDARRAQRERPRRALGREHPCRQPRDLRRRRQRGGERVPRELDAPAAAAALELLRVPPGAARHRFPRDALQRIARLVGRAARRGRRPFRASRTRRPARMSPTGSGGGSTSGVGNAMPVSGKWT